jgi:hypothetical protein
MKKGKFDLYSSTCSCSSNVVTMSVKGKASAKIVISGWGPQNPDSDTRSLLYEIQTAAW